MNIGGGLYDQPPEPASEPSSPRMVAQEWAFWIVMGLGLWAAFQGQPMTVFLLLVLIVVLGGFIVLGREIRRQYLEAKKRGFWK